MKLRLFNDVWLIPSTITNDLGQAFADPNMREQMWFVLYHTPGEHVIQCSPTTFVSTYREFFSTVLTNDPEPLLHLYAQGHRLHTGNPLDITKQHPIQNVNLEYIVPERLGFEFVLGTFLLTGKLKQSVLQYVEWCCWYLLMQEVLLFVDDMKRDIFHAHLLLGTDPFGYSTAGLWDILNIRDYITTIDIHDASQLKRLIQKWFLQADDLIQFFNNHARYHRDEQGVDSFREPVEMIYDGRYEDLLFRDMNNLFRITYASDGLDNFVVPIYLSKIYSGFKTSNYGHIEGFRLKNV